MSRGPTEKQRAFALAYLETGNAAEAYRRAYDCKSMNNNSIAREAHELLAHPKIAPIIEAHQKKNAERLEVTVESLTAKLEKAFSKADETGQTAAMVSAVMGMGKLHGLVVDKKENVTPVRNPAAIDARLRSLIDDGSEDRTSEPSGGKGEVAPAKQDAASISGRGAATTRTLQ